MIEHTDRLAQHVLNTEFDDLSPEAVAAAKTFFLDTLGVGIAGSVASYAKEVMAVATAWGAQANKMATCWGSGVKLPASAAAYVNAYQIHCQEFDCVHEPAVVHPLATIMSALMAEAEASGNISGKEFITAMAVAVDIAAGLGVATLSPIRFFRPATAGVFGATAGIAKLRQFTEQQLKDAWGYALAQAAGTMQAHVEGKPTLPLQIANASRAAHIACDLAGAGIPGPHDVFTGPFGYLSLFEEEIDFEKGFGELGQRWRIAEVSHKPFPTGRAAQGGIVAVQQLMQDYSLGAEQLDTLVLTAPPLINRLVGRPIIDELPVNYARLCFPYLAATTLIKGTVKLEDFSETARSNPQCHDLAQRIRVEDDGSTDPAAFTPQIATATLKDGSQYKARVSHLLGSPENLLSRDQHIDKFKNCVASVSDTSVDEVITRVDALETEPDTGIFARMITSK
jgi:2-methylcitrate dehydratase PrpD